MVPFLMCKLTYHKRWKRVLSTDNKLDDLFSLENMVSVFSTLPLYILNKLWPRGDSSVSGSCSQRASSLHDRALTCMVKCVYISGSLHEPMK